MIFFLYGTDAYRINEKLNELKTGFIAKKNKAGLNIAALSGDNIQLDQFKQEALSISFFGDKKMIIISGIMEKSSGSQKKQREEIAEFLKAKEKMIENNLVFVDLFEDAKKIPVKDDLFKLLIKQKYSWEYKQLRGNELSSWLKKYCADNKINLEPAAADELIMLVGNDLLQLSLELKKLSAYKKNKNITKADVAEMVRAKFDEDIFKLTDALSAKNQKLALHLISDQLRSGNAPLAILAMIQRQFRILLRLQGQLEETAGYPNKTQLAKELGLHEFIIMKGLGQIKNFSADKLKKIYGDLMEMEKQLTTGYKNPELLFDLFVVKNSKISKHGLIIVALEKDLTMFRRIRIRSIRKNGKEWAIG